MISVIIPLYNKVATVEAALRCVLAQSYQDFEIVVVDDGSTDGSADVVGRVDDSRIRLIRQANAGVSAARNRGIAEARGEYVAFLDADDEWKPDYLAVQHRMTELYPQCDVFATNYEFRDASGRVRPTLLNRLAIDGDSGVMDNYFEVASYSHPPITSISIMVRRSAIETVGGFPVGIKSGEDLLTWARLVCRYKLAFSKKTCAVYNLGDGYDYANLPPRRQDIGDPVGRGLKNLYKSHSDIRGFRIYIGHWHKMRASVAIRYGERIETLRESFKSLRYNPKNYKVLPFIVLALLPSGMRTKIISKYKGQ